MTYPATNSKEASELLIDVSNQMHEIVNEDATTEVMTESGLVPSVRKALADTFLFQDPIAWNQGSDETAFNQLRTFNDNIYWAPTATTLNPIPMGVTPEGDNNWKLAPVDVSREWTLDEITTAQNDIVGGSIFKGSNGKTVENGDVVEPGVTHLRVLVGGEPKIVEMNPVASGVVSSLTDFTATIGGAPVYFKNMIEGESVNPLQFHLSGADHTDAVSRCIDYAQSSGGVIDGEGFIFNIDQLSKNITSTLKIRNLEYRQVTANTETLTLTGSPGVNLIIDQIFAEGVGGDYVNASTGLSRGLVATGFDIVSINDLTALNFGRDGAEIHGNGKVIIHNSRTVGQDGIPEGGNYNFGLNIHDNDEYYSGYIDVSKHAMGVKETRCGKVTILSASISNILGQHGIYSEPKGKTLIANVNADNTAYNVVKVQIQASTVTGSNHESIMVSGVNSNVNGQACVSITVASGVSGEVFESVKVSDVNAKDTATPVYIDGAHNTSVSGVLGEDCKGYGVFAYNLTGVSSVSDVLIDGSDWAAVATRSDGDVTIKDIYGKNNNRDAGGSISAEKVSFISTLKTTGGSGVAKIRDVTQDNPGVDNTNSLFSQLDTILGEIDVDESKLLRIDSLKGIGGGRRPAPTPYPTSTGGGVIFGRVGREFSASTKPTQGKFVISDWIWNTLAGTTYAWLCTKTGDFDDPDPSNHPTFVDIDRP